MGYPGHMATGQEGPRQHTVRGRPLQQSDRASREMPGPEGYPGRRTARKPVLATACGLCPGAGNETLWLVTNQTVFGIQQEEVPRVGASVVSHLSPSPLTLRCCSTQRRGEGWVSGTLEPEGTLDRPGLRAGGKLTQRGCLRPQSDIFT